MPRIRYIKPEFFTDEHIAELPYEARLFFAGLWCMADRDGRLEDRPPHLKVMILPYDRVDIEKILTRLSAGEKPFIHRYQNSGKFYIQILNFLKHQKPHHTEKDSIIPVEEKKQQEKEEQEKIKGMGSVHEATTELSNGVKTVKSPLNTIFSNDFIEFWKVYPYKTGKDKAWESWQKKTPPLQECLKTLIWQVKSEQWTKESGKFIPMPTTWLNGGRWKDEPLNSDRKSADLQKCEFWDGKCQSPTGSCCKKEAKYIDGQCYLKGEYARKT